MTEPTIRNARIFVSDLRLEAHVGVNPGEKGSAQPIVVDIWVGLEDIDRAARSERLSHTVDYVGVTRAVKDVVAKRHYPLVESLAMAIARGVLDRSAAAWVKIRLRKVDCLAEASGAGVELEIQRGEPSVSPVPIEPSRLYDREQVVIVGGGAAGMSAALWCHCLGHPALLVDPALQLGGQLHMVHGQMKDLPAMPPMTGQEMNRLLWRQFIGHRGRWCRARLAAVEPDPDGCTLQLQFPSPSDTQPISLAASTVILAMGVRRKPLNVPGEQELAGLGVLTTAAKQPKTFADRQVVVVGGGDAACENALILARAGASVTLIHRGASLTSREMFCKAALQHPRITTRLNAEVTRFVGRDHLEEVEISCLDQQLTKSIVAQAALVRVGWIPNTAGLPPDWLNSCGFIRCDATGLVCGQSRIFAAGDLLGQISPSIATAFGSGATAARAACMVLEGKSS
jgi:thioredoxin reductase (NADPH)